jgi:hypothetical protein
MADTQRRRTRPAIGYAVSGPGFYSWQPSRREARAWGRDLAKASPAKAPRVTRLRAR